MNPNVNKGTVLDEALKETAKKNLGYLPQFRLMFGRLISHSMQNRHC
jgi:hypothetical protein|nr:hypothetical protein [uncultured Vibrio sp.]